MVGQYDGVLFQWQGNLTLTFGSKILSLSVDHIFWTVSSVSMSGHVMFEIKASNVAMAVERIRK